MSATTTVEITYDSFFSDEFKYLAEAYSILVVTTGILLGLFGKFYLMFNLIDSLAIIYFLFFMKVNLPTNVIDFQRMFDKFHYDYMYDYLKSIVENSYSYSVPLKFKNYGMSSFFLSNTSLSFCIIFGLLGVYVILKLVSFIPFARLQFSLKEALRRSWEFDYFIYILWIFYNQFSVFCFLQKEAIDFDTNLKIVNFIVFLLIAIILTVSPFLFAYLIQSKQSELVLPAFQRSSQIRYLSLVSGYKISSEEEDDKAYNNPNIQRDPSEQTNLNKEQIPNTDRKEIALSIKSHNENQETNIFLNSEDQNQNTPFGKYMSTFILLRKIIFAGILVLFQDHKILQVCVFSGVNSILLLLYTLSKPHILKIDNIRCAITEVCFIGIQVLICFFDDLSSTTAAYNLDSTQRKLGWLYISLCCLVIAGHLIDVLVKLALEIIKLIKKPKDISNKIVPLPVEEKLNVQQQDPIPLKQQPSPILQQEPLQTNKIQYPEKQTATSTLQNIPMMVDKKSDQAVYDRKALDLPPKTNKTSFSEFIQSDVNILPNEEKQQYKRRIRPLLFKRNPYIPKNGYYDDIIHNSDKKNNQTKTTLGLGSMPGMPTNMNFHQEPTHDNIQNF